ncbi:uncharacterized protein E5676_scaffold487G00250 [Cucumis melo var. makuwa]|uniref:Uncharacterized protein n=1 Tax=Cucumis melo var. makuwa TaxID=1194695 RepID=A0A5D3BDZ7_CUCMM|nr:uncharacterized protein E6C27_scaffold1166G00280 [Cucumis melo var. makuwa]TYJ98002.1 uncharacterized protein E5676_scaffold487G00250 [Cucumis melo var. makuwa]
MTNSSPKFCPEKVPEPTTLQESTTADWPAPFPSFGSPSQKRSKSLSLLHIFFNSKRKFDLLSPPPVSKSASLPSPGSVFDSAAGAKFTGRRSARRFPTEKEEENAAASGSVLCFGLGR